MVQKQHSLPFQLLLKYEYFLILLAVILIALASLAYIKHSIQKWCA